MTSDGWKIAPLQLILLVLVVVRGSELEGSGLPPLRILQDVNAAGSFVDNTLGYCELNTTVVQGVNTLVASEIGLIENFLEVFDMGGFSYEYAISSLDSFVELTRDYLGAEGSDDRSDRDILAVMMKKKVPGKPEEDLSNDCEALVARAILLTTAVWMDLMRVGRGVGASFAVGESVNAIVDLNSEAFLSDIEIESDVLLELLGGGYSSAVQESGGISSFSLSGDNVNSVADTLPVFLEIFKTDSPLFDKFIQTILLKSDVVSVKDIMDSEFPFFVSNWKEMVATSASYPSKYAAFALTLGAELTESFSASYFASVLGPTYDNVVQVCEMTVTPVTPAPVATTPAPVSGTPAPVIGTPAPVATPVPAPSSQPTMEDPDVDELEDDSLVPVVAVVEEGGPSEEALALSWASFREIFPGRKFCLLRVRSAVNLNLMIPDAFASDPNTIFKSVSRDKNDAMFISHWFNLCDLYDQQAEDKVALLLDIPVSEIQASYNYFVGNLNRRNLVLDSIEAGNDSNWIDPVISGYLDSPADPSSAPTSAPTEMMPVSSTPSDEPTNVIIDSPSPTAIPTEQPTQEPSHEPSLFPTQTSCEDIEGCEDCLSSDQGCVVAYGFCSSDCSIALGGATCYSTDVFPLSSPATICEFYRQDIALCLPNGNCKDCTSSFKSDGESCKWYPNLGRCFAGGCGPAGCGTDVCETDEPMSQPSAMPTSSPTEVPSPTPTLSPTGEPSLIPTLFPTEAPSAIPTLSPSEVPNPSPTAATTTTTTTLSQTYDISFTFQSVTEIDTFLEGAQSWTRLITGDISDVSGISFFTPGCGEVPSTIDDLHICARILNIDGPGGILGSAQVVLDRSGFNGEMLPLVGEMLFDEDIQQDDRLRAIVRHEIGHLIGIGQQWKEFGLIEQDEPPCPYLGSAANREYQDISGCIGDSVPVEQGFLKNPSGSNCAHWADSCFSGAELMGSRIASSDIDLPISRITVGALEDMGYEVDYSQADPISSSDLSPSCVCSRRRGLEDDPNATSTEIELSDEGYAAAVAYGLSKLKEGLSESGVSLPKGIVDKRGEMIYVLVEEAGEIHSVIVRFPDTD